MKGKRILNIVFYKYYGENASDKKACIFYADGTVRDVTFDEGIDACEVICRENHIQTKDAFKEMINKNIVHVMSGKDFGEKFNSFLPTKIVEEVEDTEDVLESEERNIPVTPVIPVVSSINDDTAKNNDDDAIEEVSLDSEEVEEETADDVDEEIEDEDFVEKNKSTAPVVDLPEMDGAEEEQQSKKPSNAAKVAAATAVGGAAVAAGAVAANKAKKKVEAPKAEETSKVETAKKEVAKKAEGIDSEELTEEPAKKKGFFARIKEKLKKNKLIKRIAVVVTALAVGLGLYSCAAKKTLAGEMYNSNLPSMETTIDKDDFYTASHVFYRYNNDKYDDYGYNQLLEVTHNKFQKEAMTNIRDGIVGFNDIFARNYEQDGVRPSLKWDEMVALQTAYNDYDKDQIKAYFNGAEIHSEDLSRAYKDANLQLMGAYAIENREHPVDMSMLIESEEGKEFYERYHEAFLQCKEATGDERQEKVAAFYAMVRKDFPITEKVRTEGISHAENYEMLDSYKLSVVPMIAATEMMYQNLPKDVTLNDQEVEFFNDLGLCNRADKTFERIETITLLSSEDNKNPLYEQFRSTMIEILKKNNMYYVDDETRELTKLDAFQDAVNWHIKEKGWTPAGTTVKNPSKPVTKTETYQEVETHTETTTTYHEEETRVEKPIPDSVKAQIDAEIEAENARRKAEAERQAELERQRLQAEADREAARIREEIRREEEERQRLIDEANKRIQQGGTVNESDFGDSGVQFDPQHQDGQGNLNDSVENITTDPTGDMTNQPLPDPNATGAKFDSQASTTTQQQSTVQNRVDTTGNTTVTQVDGGWIETTPVADGYYYEDSWVEEGDTTQQNKAAVNAYVEGLAASQDVNGEGYQYSK